MKCRLWLVSAMLAMWATAGLAQTGAPTPPKAPALEARAKGVQIYDCTARDGAYAWVLKAPEAVLSDPAGRVIGKHFAGPSWQLNDGSTVVGAPVNVTPSPRPGAIPWILLRAASHSGAGQLSDVSYIVRTATRGGAAPAKGCDAAHVKAGLRVPYTATYLFFRGD